MKKNTRKSAMKTSSGLNLENKTFKLKSAVCAGCKVYDRPGSPSPLLVQISG